MHDQLKPNRLTRRNNDILRFTADPHVLWRVVRGDLPLLEKVCREELAAELAREQRKR